MFKIAYKDTYKEIKNKFIVFLVFYELFIIFRAVDYYMRQYDLYQFNSKMHRYTEVSYYVIELMFIAFISYVGYKNKQNDHESNAQGAEHIE